MTCFYGITAGFGSNQCHVIESNASGDINSAIGDQNHILVGATVQNQCIFVLAARVINPSLVIIFGRSMSPGFTFSYARNIDPDRCGLIQVRITKTVFGFYG